MQKNWILLIIITMIIPVSCTGQEKEAKKNGLSIEEQQHQAHKEKDTSDSIKVVTEQPNFNYPAQKAMPGVVNIVSIRNPEESAAKKRMPVPEPFRDFFGEDFFFRQPPQQRKRQAAGSGVIVTDNGYIITNNHVIKGADKIKVTLHDNRSFEANVVGTDGSTDLALLKIDAENLSFVKYGDSDKVKVGDWVLAVGNPFNLASTVTAGIVSAKARNVNILRDQSAIESFIQTDAAVNPGNSGGALVNQKGELIGINTAIASPTGTYAGYAFAVPVNIVKKVVDDLKQHGEVQRAYLGVYIRNLNSDLADEINIDRSKGVYIDSIIPGTAAASANIQKKDVIIKVADKEINSASELQEEIGKRRPGDEITITLIRDGNKKTVDVTLKEIKGTKKTEDKVLEKLGIAINDLGQKQKKKLNIDYGVVVTQIREGIISETTGMKEGFVMLKVNNKKIETVNDFINELEGHEGGVMVEGFYPGFPTKVYYAFGMDEEE